MDTCSICCEPFTKMLRKPVDCKSCEISVCLKCTKTYIMDTLQDAHCMGCRNAWNREFLDGILSKTFVEGDYKKHRENILLDREKALLPETMPDVETYLQTQKLTLKLTELRKNKRTIRLENVPPEGDHIEARLAVLKKNQDKQLKIFLIDQEMVMIDYHRYLLENETKTPTERRQFVRACPADDCRGFLSSQWKCGLCEVWVCPTCHEVKGDNKDAEHTCKPENVATAQLLTKDTRPCPKCAAMIFKISGCDQIWCTQCETAFSWNKGTIETGVIHNPHYYEYMRTNGGLPRAVGDVPCAVGDVPCGGMPTIYTIRLWKDKIDDKYIQKLTVILRAHHHIEVIEVNNNQVNQVNDNRDLRIIYLAKEIDEQYFKRMLQKREKINNRKREVLMVWQMLLLANVDITQRLVADIEQKDKVSAKTMEKYMNEYDTLARYVHECLQKIRQRYNQKITILFDTWSLIDV